ncbi:MAG: MYXO-CTERM sorting domain-containing protein, partial [Myxococcales bacterium]|nr:MYXO-CTERM sorting domain-containing protein [Myxococcales bacterium]
ALAEISLAHHIPKDFVIRAYFDRDSPIWQRVSEHPRAKVELYRMMNPDALLPDVAGAAGLAPAEQLVMIPEYLNEIHRLRDGLRTFLESEIVRLQDPADPEGAMLGVTAGPDGVLGTSDDVTACTAGCAQLAGRYYGYVNLLAPRADAAGRPLESAFDKIGRKLRDDIDLFVPAFVDVIEQLSALLNRGVTDTTSGFDMDSSTLGMVMGPLDTWVDQTTTIDYRTLTVALLPDWAIGVSDFLAGLGLPFADLVAIIEGLFQPIVDAIRETIQTYVLEEARVFLDGFMAEYEALEAMVRAENLMLLDEGADPALGGNALDFLEGSGLWAYSFNIIAVALADHRIMLVEGDSVESGPTSFDASYTLSWTQPGLCNYMRDAVFPYGLDVSALFTVERDQLFPGRTPEDSPIECHDGMLTAFGDPSVEACAFLGLEDLILDPAHTGSVSRAFPPLFAAGEPVCLNYVLEGLPAPPPGGDRPTTSPDGGCGCRVAGVSPRSGSGAGWLALMLLGLLLLRRARARIVAPHGSRARLDSRAPLGSRAARRLASRSTLLLPLSLLIGLSAAGCGGGSATSPDGAVPDAGMDADVDSGMMIEDLSYQLIDALGTSRWVGAETRLEEGMLRERAIELQFMADAGEWAEIRNPYGPARLRTLRTFDVEPDAATVNSVVLSPDGWPYHFDNGLAQTWTFEVIDASPRILIITDEMGDSVEYVEGAWPAPTEGMTAHLRVFASGELADFCDTLRGIEWLEDPERQMFWSFARGESSEIVLDEDWAAGVPLSAWAGNAHFSATDVPGFYRSGGTFLSDSHYFITRYTGTIAHAGGDLGVREADDVAADALWVFLGPNVGSRSSAALALEVHSWSNFDATADEEIYSFPAGDVPVEVIVLRCTGVVEDTRLQMNPSGAGWRDMNLVAVEPELDPLLFPPALF